MKGFGPGICACAVTVVIKEDLEMTQFFLVERDVVVPGVPRLQFSPIQADEDLLRTVATEYFDGWQGCRLVYDETGAAEPLFDDVVQAQEAGEPIEDTRLMVLLRYLTEVGVAFVLWHGSDHQHLPLTNAWADVVTNIRAQTVLQPADVYLAYSPHIASLRSEASLRP